MMKIKAIVVAVIFLLFAAILYYLFIILPTNVLFVEAKNIFNGGAYAQEGDPLARYNFEYRKNAVSVESWVRRIWVWHNGQKGYMLVNYTCRYFDADGEAVSWSVGIDSKWYIEKQNGKWVVTDIEEAP